MELEKQEVKKLFKVFVFLFLISFLIINWESVSWVFNYKAISITISRFFSRENPSKIAENLKEIPGLEKFEFEFSEKENTLEIPRIEISAPIFSVNSQDEKKVLESLDRGVVLYSDFAFPGQAGQTIISGHSTMHDWPKSNPAWVFTYLRDVIEGDEIIIHFNHRKYSYSVTKKFTLKTGEDISSYPLTNSENVLTLITCWPPGRLSLGQRLAVEARLKK